MRIIWCEPRKAWTNRLFPGSPGTTTGPCSPPFIRVSYEVRSRPSLGLLAPWQPTQLFWIVGWSAAKVTLGAALAALLAAVLSGIAGSLAATFESVVPPWQPTTTPIAAKRMNDLLIVTLPDIP